MKQNYYTVDEAMAILEPRIRAMFREDASFLFGSTSVDVRKMQVEIKCRF